MFKFNTVAAVMALALSAPMVCQAQDPNASLAQVKQLAGSGKTEDALKLCDKVIQRFSGESNLGKQFSYVLPFYYWEKGGMLAKAGNYDEAFNAYKELTEAKWKSSDNMSRVRAALPGREDAYNSLLNNSVFQMGYCRYKQAAGTEEKAGDPAMFEEAVKYLKQYYEMLKSGKVSAVEKKQKLDGQVCFLLMQASLLKPEPDFKTADAYLKEGSKGKTKLPDDIAMGGLSCIVKVATENPQYIDWVYKVVESSRASFDLGALRSAKFANKFLNLGMRVGKVADAALAANNVEQAMAAMRSMNALLGLVPDTAEVEQEADAMLARLGSYKRPINDPAVGARYTAEVQKKTQAAFGKLLKDKMYMEGYAVLQDGNSGYSVGSPRLAKAAYQVIYDHYRDLSRKGKDGKVESMRDRNIFQLAQFSYATGDEAAGAKYEKMVEGANMGDGQKNIVFNKMRRALQSEAWEDVVNLAHDVMAETKADKSGQMYLTAQFSEIAALFKQHKYEDVIAKGNELLSGGNLKAEEGPGKLRKEQVDNYESQTMFYVLDSHVRLGASSPAELDKAMESFRAYIKRFPSLNLEENKLAANVYYDAIDALLKRNGKGNEEAAKKDLSEALKYCGVIAENWPDHTLYANAQLLAGNIRINGEDPEAKLVGIEDLEKCAAAALKREGDKGKQVAANALYWLASYAVELPREGESPEALQARVKGYTDQFWSAADFEGNPYALQMASLQVSRAAKGKDAALFDAACDKARDVISREATVAFKNNKSNEDLEKAINSYAEAYIGGTESLKGKKLTLEEKVSHFENFPGIDPQDKYTNAILRMSLISAMNSELAAVKDDEAAKSKLTDDIEKTFREMTNAFKPEDLTSFICVQVGDYLLKYVSRFDNPSSKKEELNMAKSYFDQVISRGRDQMNPAKLGKAQALALLGDDASKQEAVALYRELSDSADVDVAGPALMGLTKALLAVGDNEGAVEAANKYTKNRRMSKNRLDMYLLLGQAYGAKGDYQNALLAYMNIYNQNRGNIAYSAPACSAMMQIMWKRNNPASGERTKGNFHASDHWTAWRTGRDFLNQIERSKLVEKLTPADRDKYNVLVQEVKKYEADGDVQKEERERKAFEARLKDNRK